MNYKEEIERRLSSKEDEQKIREILARISFLKSQLDWSKERKVEAENNIIKYANALEIAMTGDYDRIFPETKETEGFPTQLPMSHYQSVSS